MRGPVVEVDEAAPLVVHLAENHRAHEAMLVCDMFSDVQPFDDEGRASFREIPGESCRLVLNRDTEPFAPVYPGDQLDCWLERQRTRCTGGFADTRFARLSIRSAASAAIVVDGMHQGRLPVLDLKLKPGKHKIQMLLGDGRTRRMTIHAEPNEEVRITLNVPGFTGDPGWPLEEAPSSLETRATIEIADGEDPKAELPVATAPEQ